MIKVVVNGARGKMGQETVRAVSVEQDLELVAAIDHGDDLALAIRTFRPDVVVDFTHPDSVMQNTLTILNEGANAIIGTTGLTEAQLSTIEATANAKSLAALVIPNFAIGAILMMKFAAEAAKYMPKVEIIEFHHDKKADAPSGTAIKTADMIHSVNHHINSNKLEETELIEGARGGRKHNIPIHSVRLPGYVASQEVILGGVGQTLVIRHDTISRESFMPGVILSVRKIKQITGLVYGLENVLHL
ncbi:4-hydroxy-tetrahydrodipicolinate reductase [bacterium]|nr:4-hydroxy-tetrahydrodipicolinate reductase [bacterium]